MHSTLIRRMAARWTLRADAIAYAVAAAHTMLDSGIYTYSLGELATLPPDWHWSTFERFFHGALHDFGCEVPDEKSAVITFVAEQLEEVYEGRCTFNDVMAAIDVFDWEDIKRLGEIPACRELFEWYWHWEALREWMEADAEEASRRLLELENGIQTLAAVWIPSHSCDAISPEARTTDVLAIAQAIDAERAFDRLPILADALEDAGCTNADVLEHCRQPLEHVRGCWVVDLLLGKG